MGSGRESGDARAQCRAARGGAGRLRPRPRRGGGHARRGPAEPARGDPTAPGGDRRGPRRGRHAPRGPQRPVPATRDLCGREPSRLARRRGTDDRLRLHVAGLPASGGRGDPPPGRARALHSRARGLAGAAANGDLDPARGPRGGALALLAAPLHAARLRPHDRLLARPDPARVACGYRGGAARYRLWRLSPGPAAGPRPGE